MIKAVKLYLRENTTFDVLFNDGLTKKYDILKLTNVFPQLNALKNRDLFLKGHLLGWSGIIWNDELDIEIETVYEDGQTVDNDDNVESILTGFKLRELRKECGLTQQELSKRCGVPQADISKIEKGQFNPTISMLVKLSKGLDKKIIITIN